jgi:hypothetical protein
MNVSPFFSFAFKLDLVISTKDSQRFKMFICLIIESFHQGTEIPLPVKSESMAQQQHVWYQNGGL